MRLILALLVSSFSWTSATAEVRPPSRATTGMVAIVAPHAQFRTAPDGQKELCVVIGTAFAVLDAQSRRPLRWIKTDGKCSNHGLAIRLIQEPVERSSTILIQSRVMGRLEP